MERIAFDVVTQKKGVLFDISNSEKLMFAGFMGFGFLLIFGALFHKIYKLNILNYLVVNLIGLTCIICIVIGRLMSYRDYHGNDLAVNSILFFNEDEVTFDYTEVFPLSEITYIKFKIFQYKGVRIGRDPKKSSGADNYIEFQHEGKKHKFQFVIESEGHMQLLKEKLIPQLREKTKVTYS